MINDTFLDKIVLGDESSVDKKIANRYFGGLEFKKNPAYKNINSSSTCTISVEGEKTVLPSTNSTVPVKQNSFITDLFGKIKKTIWSL
jgi:hypothetical protein